ncbi:MAG: MFS transporter [Alphaproteobacteria bacterium]|nr:MFS transporter [Alphaproteobacteria bacterium]MBU1516064.1 MFS transporter [Alphaproteobacteria bacterium]MBU2092721.1 MFS transporter [Alphaproteobacteria bacterium]MBU2153754.1 MFS transporter [Alphaproteobacteria bacterium]MBU2308382.1 MFS transporter [Alphaproteobacteria bacterium]
MNSEAAPRGGGYAWYVVAVLLLAYTLSFIDRMILSLLVGPIRADLGISDTQMSLLMGFAFAIFYSVLGIPLGWLADRGSRRGLMVAGVAAWSVMTAICGLTRSYTTLFLARIGVGVGEATLSPAAYSLLGDYFPREKLGRAMAVYSIGVPLGSGIALVAGALVVKFVTEGPPLILPLLGAMEPWRLTFVVIGLPGLLVALLIALTVREPARGGGKAGLAKGEFLAFLKTHPAALAAHMGGMSMITLVMYGAMAWIPQFLHRTYAMPIPQAGLWFGGATAICGAIGLMAGGWLADGMYRRGYKDAHLRVIRLNAGILLVTLTGMALAPTAGIALAMMILTMLLGTIHGGVAGAALQMVTPNRLRARMVALYFLIANLIGLGCGPTAMALITDLVFHDDAALRYAIAIITALAMPVSILVLSLGLKPFARAVVEAEAAAA